MENTGIENQFVINTKSHCFFCFKVSPRDRGGGGPGKTNGGEAHSLQNLCKYLSLDLEKIFNEMITTNVPLKKDLMGVLCSDCAKLSVKFSKLYLEFKKIQRELTIRLTEIHGKMAKVEEEESCSRSSVKAMFKKKMLSDPETWFHFGLVERVRKQALEKCYRKIEKIQPEVSLEDNIPAPLRSSTSSAMPAGRTANFYTRRYLGLKTNARKRRLIIGVKRNAPGYSLEGCHNSSEPTNQKSGNDLGSPSPAADKEDTTETPIKTEITEVEERLDDPLEDLESLHMSGVNPGNSGSNASNQKDVQEKVEQGSPRNRDLSSLRRRRFQKYSPWNSDSTNGDRIDCNYCEKSFSSKSNLWRHVRLHHEKRLQLKCNNCLRLFSDPYYFKVHKKKCEHQ